MKDDLRLEKQLEEEFAEDVLDLRSTLDKITKEKVSPKADHSNGKRLRMFVSGLAIAASLILAAIFIPGLWSDSGSTITYADVYEPYPMALNQRGNADSSDLDIAISRYLEEQYDDAGELFEAVYLESENDIHLLYAASANQAASNFSKAIELYDRIIEKGNPKVIEQALWYKALALMHEEKSDQAKDILQSLETKHYKYKEAQKLLNSM